jgi:MerR family redox-sensitive transcriptional activator SoxR
MTTAAIAGNRSHSQPTLTVQQIAERAGVAGSAVRFYERHGLISACRTSSNQRRFDETAACRIKVARVAQRVGLTIREIAEHFDRLPADPGPEDWREVAVALITQARQRIRTLEFVLDDLSSGRKLCDLAE